MTAAGETPADLGGSGTGPVVSARVAAAQARALERWLRQIALLRPLTWVSLLVVVIPAMFSEPKPGLHGAHLAVLLVVIGYTATLLALLYRPSTEIPWIVGCALVLGVTGVALVLLQPKASDELPPSVAILITCLRLQPRAAAMVAGPIAVALAAAETVGPRGSVQSAVAGVLLCVVLAMMAGFARRARENQDRAEILLAELADAREAEARSAVIAERARIARDLHDVLAHSLSGLAIQLQGARKLAERDAASDALRGVLDQAGLLVKEGLTEAKRAVQALREDEQPGLGELPDLVDRLRRDLGVEASFDVTGTPRALPSGVALALYRGAQEALTNVARYAPGATTAVTLRYGEGRVVLSVRDQPRATASDVGPGGPPPTPTPTVTGGGNGLRGLRERIAQVGGVAEAGPVDGGWLVEMEVPA